ncbi:hypothetical protein [Ornithinibacillus sp. 179-J 7C1 HS]|uniref:hypothetical protein n=1 Tax=Ornithinibacillus sp. 179-J 7C1 HS TaxID=3142384 RepID=UPI0039A0CE17
MNRKQQFISDQYHFIGEMLILSIIMLVPNYFYYQWISKSRKRQIKKWKLYE